MSLIPYHAREGREIVLRHHNAIVVRDPDSQRLEIRRGECPTCHQPLGRSPSPDQHRERQFDLTKEYVDPEYFRMLRAGLSPGPCSPVRRLVPPALAGSSSTSTSGSGPLALGEEAEFALGSSGACQDERSRIRRDAFSPNYFKTFFVEETTLGRGGKGVVLLVRHEIDGCQLGHFACKRVPVGNDHTWLEKVLIEVEFLAKLSHPNLVSYRHAWLEDVKLTRFGPSVVCAFILQQYCSGGDLHQYVVGSAPREATKEELKAQIRRRSKGQADPPRDLRHGRPQLSFDDIYSLFKDITSGVAYLHAANYIHRDLKPSNCLLHNEGGKLTCLISDFGEVQPENMARNSTGSTGTISYCAPEVLKMDSVGQYGNFTTKSDMFSLGMILYFMCFGRLPYQGANAIQEELEDLQLLRSEIIGWEGFQDERRERPDLPTRLYKLLKKLLAMEPAERPGANEVLAAMRSETSFDGITWGERVLATSRVSRGIRVQNLDSPAAPSTPDLAQTEGSWKQATVQDESGPWPKLGDRGSALMQLGDKATQTLPRPGVSQRRGRTQSRLVDDARTGRDGHDEQTTGPDELFSPPLLMAPPRSRLAEMAFRMKLVCHRLVAVIVVGWDLFGCVARLGLFLLKLGTLTRSCWPYAVSIEVSVPLVIVASLDLGLSRGRLSKSLNGGRIQARYDAISNTGIFCGLRASLLLLALHFTVLWLARQWNSLCVGAARDSWAD